MPTAKNPCKMLKGLPVIYVDENTIIYGPNVYEKCGVTIDLNDWPEAKKQWEDVINGSGDFAQEEPDKEKRLRIALAALGFVAGAIVTIISVALL